MGDGSQTSTIRVVLRDHVRAHYHVLSHFDLGRDPVNCACPTYTELIAASRPSRVTSPARALGVFHRHFRSASGRHVLAVLPLAVDDDEEYRALLDSLATQAPPPATLPPLIKRAIAPLADKAGARLVRTLRDLLAAERRGYLDSYYRRQDTIGEAQANALGNYLSERIVPLLPVLYGDAPQTVTVYLSEPLIGRSRAIVPARRKHHIATSDGPHWRDMLFQVLLAVVQHRTNRLIKHYLPENVAANPTGLVAHLMRFDAAMTTTYHLLLRRSGDLAEDFKDWASGQFKNTGRPPLAAVEALHPMVLLPEEAITAVRALLGDEVDDLGL